MHIVQIAPPWISLPPLGYGGIERVVHDLCEGFVEAGHQVTLCAPGDSVTSARLIATAPRGVGLDLSEVAKAEWFERTSRFAYEIARELEADVVHDHTDYVPLFPLHIPLFRTLHGPAVDEAVQRYGLMSNNGDQLVAISHNQRQHFERVSALPELARPIAFAGVVHNPVHVDSVPYYPPETKANYVAFLGRCHWEKDPAAAIRVAMAAGIHLKMALRVSDGERPYFDAVVAPLLEQAGDLVEFLGEVGGSQRDDLIGKASTVIFPSPWEEPFGLVLIEAAARGTPVVAFRKGSAPEIVADGVTGILCADEAAMVRELPRAMGLDPYQCRLHAQTHFDRRTITERYLHLYQRAVTRHQAPQMAVTVG
jgi:glycosyltransferase involved in cell wall biosynthesis